ncbi:MAG: hypothetical protein IT385_14935 [Deltaproteobacteria bacterium]|nr:hypothetical protein [Deltaproteobacteria bacterium]
MRPLSFLCRHSVFVLVLASSAAHAEPRARPVPSATRWFEHVADTPALYRHALAPELPDGATFVTRQARFRVALGASGFVMRAGRDNTIRAAFVGPDARPLAWTPGRRLASVTHDLRGPSEAWVRDIPHARDAHARDVYPGVDVRFTHRAGAPAFDLHLRRADRLAHVRLRVDGALDVALESGGAVFAGATGRFAWSRPVAFQAGRRLLGRFELLPAREGAAPASSDAPSRVELGLVVPGADPALPLWVDPSITYATYVADSAVDHGVAADGAGDVYLAGLYYQVDLPLTTDLSLGNETFLTYVMKLDRDAGELAWVTLLGPTPHEDALVRFEPRNFAVSAAGRPALMLGLYCFTEDCGLAWPLSERAAFTDPGPGLRHALAVLETDGRSFAHSTFLRSESAWRFQPNALAVAPSGAMLVTGSLACDYDGEDGCPDPSTYAVAPLQAQRSQIDLAILYMDDTHEVRLATPFGGAGDDYGDFAAIGPDGSLYVAGRHVPFNAGTDPPGFPVTPGAWRTTTIPGRVGHPFLVRIAPTRDHVVYATYLPSYDFVPVGGIAVRPDGGVWVAVSDDTLAPTTPIPGTEELEQGQLLLGLAPSGAGLTSSTFLPGFVMRSDPVPSMMLARPDGALVVSLRASPDLVDALPPPLWPALAPPDGADAVHLVKIAPNGAAILWALAARYVFRVPAFDALAQHEDTIYVTGETDVTDLATPDAFRAGYIGGASDHYLAAITDTRVLDTCALEGAPDGAECTDGDMCTVDDACTSGACASGPYVTCRPTEPCREVRGCDPALGCLEGPGPDGEPCADGAGVCADGACVTIEEDGP